MINLLATERKDEIKAARVNVILVRYTTIVVMAFLFIGGALFVSHAVLTDTMAYNESIIESNDIKADVYSATQQQINGLSAKLNDTKAILNQEIRYSQVLVNLGQLMPPGTVLGDLTLNTESFSGKSTEIKAYAKSTDEVALLQAAFQNSPLFIPPVTIKDTGTSQEIDGYPVTLTISVILNRAGI